MMPRHLSVPAWLGVAALAVGLAGCASSAPEVTSLSQLGGNDVMLVGRIELVPPLKQGEQRINVLSPTKMEGQVFVLPADHYELIEDDFTMKRAQGYISAPFGTTFYVKEARKPLYVNGVFFYITFLRDGTQERAFLPAGMKVEIKPEDRAVYVGTIRYHRNEFFEVSKVEIVNNISQETAAFRAKFGGDVKLIPRLAIPPGAPKPASPQKHSGG